MPKTLGLLIIAAIVSLVAVLSIYFFNFNNGFSSDTRDWGSFGAYIGGTLGPTFALMAFILGVENLKTAQKKNKIDSLLNAIVSHEKKLSALLSLVVNSDRPGWWKIDAGQCAPKRVSFNTILNGKNLDCSFILTELRSSFKINTQENGDVISDHELFFNTRAALIMIFELLRLYEDEGGEAVLCRHYRNMYYTAISKIEKNFNNNWSPLEVMDKRVFDAIGEALKCRFKE